MLVRSDTVRVLLLLGVEGLGGGKGKGRTRGRSAAGDAYFCALAGCFSDQRSRSMVLITGLHCSLTCSSSMLLDRCGNRMRSRHSQPLLHPPNVAPMSTASVIGADAAIITNAEVVTNS